MSAPPQVCSPDQALCLSVQDQFSGYQIDAFYGQVSSSGALSNYPPNNNCVASNTINTTNCAAIKGSYFTGISQQDVLKGCLYISKGYVSTGWFCFDLPTIPASLQSPIPCNIPNQVPSLCKKESANQPQTGGDGKNPAGSPAPSGKSEATLIGGPLGNATPTSGPSTGVIIGAVVGGVLILIIIAVIIFLIIRRNRRKAPGKASSSPLVPSDSGHYNRDIPEEHLHYIPQPPSTSPDLMGNTNTTLQRRQGSFPEDNDVNRRPSSYNNNNVPTDFPQFQPPPEMMYGSDVGMVVAPPMILPPGAIFQSVEAESEQSVVDAYGSLLTRIHTFATRYVENHYPSGSTLRQPGIVFLSSTAPTANVDAVKHLTATELYQSVFIAGLTVPEKEAAYAAFLVAGPPIHAIPPPPLPGVMPGPPAPGTTFMPSREIMGVFEELHMGGGDPGERQRVIFRGLAEWLQAPGVLSILTSVAQSGSAPEHLGPAVVPVLQELSTAVRRAVRGITRGLVVDETGGQRHGETSSTSTSGGSTGSSVNTVSQEERKVVESLVVQAMTVMFRVKAVDVMYKFLLPAKGDSVRSKYMDVVGGGMVEKGVGEKVKGVVVVAVAPGLVKDAGEGKIIKYKAQVWADAK